jgi:hypothetical protein
MKNLPDEDAKLIDFLRQNRSILPPELPELEDRLMSQIDLLTTEKAEKNSHSWRRYIIGGIVSIVAASVSIAIFQIMNPPEPSIAELNQLNLFLEAYLPDLSNQPELGTGERENLVELDPDLF